MTAQEMSRFVRLRVELVLEIGDPTVLTRAALDRIEEDAGMADEERGRARDDAQRDPAEALAYLIDPVELVDSVPGAELAQASWTCEEIPYDPDAADWERAMGWELDDELDHDLDDEADDEAEEPGRG
ncbi:hypothetical protein LRS74_19985 [Streptomyces sp. LX-29]|uniref:hypothetical protein n=1 Tax=Streptomyces sp. LX-29 TaxID=2900152 RepID=UPI00240D19D3|nr:hypothetical protein [Streptomyces sp. LX-29]WFB09065.1 hypothetical protein LRS74_19985 [Streptomyces sp. LX-29]